MMFLTYLALLKIDRKKKHKQKQKNVTTSSIAIPGACQVIALIIEWLSKTLAVSTP